MVFQSTLPRRERPVHDILVKETFKISIHAPAKGATNSCSYHFRLFAISIHAPAKGATTMILLYHLLSSISIHAPAKGATTYAAATANGGTNFNPRSREGSDL